MFRYAAVLLSMLVSPAWATDVATLNGVPVTALQTYSSFADQLKESGWTPVVAAGADDELDCDVVRPTCDALWQGPDGKRFYIQVDHRDDANEFYVTPKSWAAKN